MDYRKRRTFLEQIGFNDPDLKCPEHDRMSFALSDPQFCRDMLLDAGVSCGSVSTTKLESPIEKGAGQYAVIIGYADSIIEFTAEASPVYLLIKEIINAKVLITLNDEGLRYNAPVGAMSDDLRAKIVLHRDELIKILRDDYMMNPRHKGEALDASHLPHPCHFSCVVDAKTSLPNPMETLRQMNTYRNFFTPGPCRNGR